MDQRSLAATGSVPAQPGYYWYCPSAESAGRARCLCEKRSGDPGLWIVGGLKLAAPLPGDRFFGPLAPPDQKWTLYWPTGVRQVIEGEEPYQAMRNAGMGGANPFRTLCLAGDDHSRRWNEQERVWELVEKAEAAA